MLSSPLGISFAGSILAAIAIGVYGKLKGWWWTAKSRASIELATRVLQFSNGAGDEKTGLLVAYTKHLGDVLIASYKANTTHNPDYENRAHELLAELLTASKPLATELSAAPDGLRRLYKTFIAYQKGLEWRAQIIRHLCHPPNPPAMDAGHVREQLLSENTKPYDLLRAVRGEAMIFLRGYGLSPWRRFRHLMKIRKTHRKKYREAVVQDYRTLMQQTSGANKHQ